MRHVRVLIAEDNDDHMFLAQLALQGLEGVQTEVIAAQDGVEAMDYLQGRGHHSGRELPHLVLLDLSMPRKDGLTVLRELRQDPVLGALPVVVLTSSSRPEDINTAYQLGASSYVNKSHGLSGLVDYWTAVASLPSLSTN